jgi:hypothetical protein
VERRAKTFKALDIEGLFLIISSEPWNYLLLQLIPGKDTVPPFTFLRKVSSPEQREDVMVMVYLPG